MREDAQETKMYVRTASDAPSVLLGATAAVVKGGRQADSGSSGTATISVQQCTAPGATGSTQHSQQKKRKRQVLNILHIT